MMGFGVADLYRFTKDLFNGINETLKDVPRKAIGWNMDGFTETLEKLADFRVKCKQCLVRLTYEPWALLS
jgi:hypothetical protein